MVCLNNFTQELSAFNTIWVAFSGGVDSHVLLHVLAQHALPLKVIHVNHNVSPQADIWQQHCAKVCGDLNIEFIYEKITATKNKTVSLEAFLREQRYQLLAKHIAADDVLVTAHHQDDQAETLLLQLLRGAGTKGLAAMPVKKKFAKGCLLRPFLEFSRQQIVDYALQHNLQWLEDESNSNQNLSRNFLRHQVLPLLKKHYPAVNETLARTAQHCADTENFISETLTNEFQPNAPLPLNKLRAYTELKQRYVLRAWLQAHNILMPSLVKLQQLQKDFLTARHDKNPRLVWDNHVIYRYQENLYIEQCDSHDSVTELSWNLNQALEIKSIGTLTAVKTMGKGLRADIDDVSVRFRSGGERIKLPQRNFHSELKKLFQQLKIPTWQRARIPLLFVGEELAMVVGYYIAENYLAEKSQPGYEVSLETM